MPKTDIDKIVKICQRSYGEIPIAENGFQILDCTACTCSEKECITNLKDALLHKSYQM